ncbi:MAG: efflux RND transporter periplasmic adaptor subunit, partial [Verrucomicrobiota bacterium]
NHERVTKLWEQKVLSQSEVDTTVAAYTVAVNRYQDALEEIRTREAMAAQRRAELEIARQQFADTTIAAPFDGTIQERRANTGEYLAAGSPIVTLVRMDPLRLRLEISEKEAFKIQVNQKVRVTLEGRTNIYSGEIKRLSPALNERSRILLIEADVRNDGSLHPGSFARAAIVIDEKALALTVPRNAVVTFAGIEKVLSIHEGKAVERRIATGDRAADWIEIVSGLKIGDVVILNPGNLQTGSPVVVAD